MPEIISVGSSDPNQIKQNPLKKVWEKISSLDKFTKMLFVTTLLLVTATPLIVKSVITLNQHAAENPQANNQQHQRAKTLGYIIEYKDAPLSNILKKGMSPQAMTQAETNLGNTDKQVESDILKTLDKKSFSLDKSIGDSIGVRAKFKYVLNGIALDITQEQVGKLKQSPYVKAIYPDLEVKTNLMDSVPMIGADKVWQNIKDAKGNPVTGKGVNVAVLDTGIDYTHADLGNTKLQERSLFKVPNGIIDRNTMPYWNQSFSLDGNRLAYPSGVEEVTIYDIDTNQSSRIDLSTPGQGLYKYIAGLYLKGDILLYVDEREDEMQVLFYKNLKTGEKKIISDLGPMVSKDVYSITVPKFYLSGNKIMYERQISKVVTGSEFKTLVNVFIYDLNTDKETKLFADDTDYFRYPRVSGDKIVFSEKKPNDDFNRIAYVYDINTGEKKALDIPCVVRILDFNGDNVLSDCYGAYYYLNLATNNLKFINVYYSPVGGPSLKDQWWLRFTVQYIYPEGLIGDNVLYFPSQGGNPFFVKKIIAYDLNKDKYFELTLNTPSGHMETNGKKICFSGVLDSQIYCEDYDSNSDYPLPSNIYNSKVVSGFDFNNWLPNAMDDYGHGTHVAGIIAGNGKLKGVAPDVNLFAYKVLNLGAGSYYSILYAIDTAISTRYDTDATNDISVMNLSIGADCGPKYDADCGPDDVVSKAIDNATANGIVSVIAAGNAGEYGSSTIGSPGTARTAITVGAVDKSKKIAVFSSKGPVKLDNEVIVKPDIVAPGVDICSAEMLSLILPEHKCLDNSHISLSGTSMATPHVAGIAALILQLHPDWTPAQVKDAIKKNADNLPDYDENTQGAGLVDALKIFNIAPTPIKYTLTPSSEGKVSMEVSKPNTSYGIYAILKDEKGAVVTDQTDFQYLWTSEDPTIVNAFPFDGCTNGILSPCPLDHAMLKAYKAGFTTVTVEVMKKSINKIVASAKFAVTVTAPTVPTCVQSTIPPATGYAPLTVTLHGGGQAGGNDSKLVGYQWDFENDGKWDTGVSMDPVTHTYQTAGTYNPKYRIQGENKLWSKTCDYKYPVVAQKLNPPTKVTCALATPVTDRVSWSSVPGASYRVYNSNKILAYTSNTYYIFNVSTAKLPNLNFTIKSYASGQESALGTNVTCPNPTPAGGKGTIPTTQPSK